MSPTSRAAAKALSDVTLVINNAGVASFSSLADDGSLEIARKAMETNYFGTLRVANAFAPILAKNGGGALVNMLSVLTWSHLSIACRLLRVENRPPGRSPNALRQELKAQGTLVVGVHAGLIDTDMAAGGRSPEGHAGTGREGHPRWRRGGGTKRYFPTIHPATSRRRFPMSPGPTSRPASRVRHRNLYGLDRGIVLGTAANPVPARIRAIYLARNAGGLSKSVSALQCLRYRVVRDRLPIDAYCQNGRYDRTHAFHH